VRKTFELVAENGPAQEDFNPLLAALDPDQSGALDGVHDKANQPLADEPQRVRADLNAVLARARPKAS